MNEVISILKKRLKELKEQEAGIRKENMKLQDRSTSNSEHLAAVAKQVVQFEEALQKLED